MNHYFVANIKINDPDEYQKYLNKIDEVCAAYNVEYLAVDEHPQILEGNWKYTKTVLMKFNSKEDFDKWYFSIEYQKILRYRLHSANCDSILVEGLE